MLLKAAKARAALDGRDHALPDDVQAIAPAGARAPAVAGRRARSRRAALGDRPRRAGERCRRCEPGARISASPGRCCARWPRCCGTPALYVPGIALLLAAVVAPSWRGAGAARVRLTLYARPGDGVRGRERLTLDAGAAPRARARSPDAAARAAARARGAVEPPPRRRGQLDAVGRARAPRTPDARPGAGCASRDPLGVCSREVQLGGGRAAGAAARASGSTRRRWHARIGAGAARTAAARDAVAEVEGLTPYTPGAPASRIHWPTVARTGVLMERVLRPARPTSMR